MAEIRDTSPAGLPQAAKEVITCAVVMVALAAFIVSLRIYTRLTLLGAFGKDDFCILVALLFSVGNSVGMGMQATTALGRHIWDLTPEDVTMFLKEVYFTIISYNIGLYFVKLSILFLYLRLFTSASSTLRRVSHVVVTIVVFASLWAIFSSALFCLPVASFWDKSIKGKCLPLKPRWYAGAALNILTDFMILILPLPSIKNLQLPRRQKLALSLIFAVGFLFRLYCFNPQAAFVDHRGVVKRSDR
ncbi:hypothetical protein DL771_010904 [Monosporascus sp. 5C6A]|nr:hypothetical protein DL771_010904 [Monosporascus sp. 5C6A]